MENTTVPENGLEPLELNELNPDAAGVETETVPDVRIDVRPYDASWHYAEGEGSLLDAGFTLELRNVKTAMVIAPNHPIPVSVEGLLLEHYEMPLSAEMEVVLMADDREIVRERFFLPTNRRAEIMDAHRELAKMSADFLTDSRLRDKAMSVYFPELSEKYDLWYRIGINEEGCMEYAVHLGPSHNQEVKKRVEGILQL